MAKQSVNIGTSENKGDGDPLRTAFQKINENFDELYTGNFSAETDIKGSVFGDDSTLLVDGANSSIPSSVIQGSEADNWTEAYSWGDHATAGYITTETDPVVGAVNGIVKADGAGNISAAVAGTDYLQYAEKVQFTARNASGSTLEMGTVVYISGLSGNTPEVDRAKADSSSTMPAFGIVQADTLDNNEAIIITFGSCPGHDASIFAETGITFTIGDTLYVSAAEAGKMTNVPPAGESNKIQNIGKVERATPTTNMTLKIGGAGRTNATPALDEGNIFIGDANNRAVTASLATSISTNLKTINGESLVGVGDITISGGGTNMASLTDVDSVDTVTTGDVLLHDGSEYKFVNLEGEINTRADARISVASIQDLSDVDSVDTVAAGDFLLYDGSSSEYKFVAFQDEVNLLIDNRTGSSGHIATQAQYAGTITSDPTDPTDTAHHTLGNTGTPSVQGASTAWYYGDVVSDPANPTTSVVLDIDQQRFTGSIQSDNISLGSPGSFTAQAGATLDLQGTTVHFGSATIAGGNAFNPVINNHLWSGATAPTDGYVLSWNTSLLSGAGDYEWVAQGSGGTWATLGDKDGANGPTSIVLGRNAIAQGPYGFALGNGALSDAYGMAFGMETQAAGYGVQIGAFSGKNHVATNSLYSVGIGSFTHQNANPGDETGQGAIALGSYAGDANQGGMAVALGYMAGRNNQAANSIVLNATGIELENLTPNSFVVKPIRQQSQAQALFYDPASGEVTYDAAPGGGGGTGLQSRSTATGTTTSLADAAEADLDITGFKAYTLLTITTDRAARVRLYVNSATRTADASRAEGIDPTSDAGLIAEVITTGTETVIISPGAYGFNLESSPTTTIPCRVTNKSGGTSTVQVDLNILQLEA